LQIDYQACPIPRTMLKNAGVLPVFRRKDRQVILIIMYGAEGWSGQMNKLEKKKGCRAPKKREC